MTKVLSLLYPIFLLWNSYVAQGELFTAVVELEPLLHTESVIINALQKYIVAEESRLQQVKKLIEEYGKVHAMASLDAQTFLGNPVNAYLLVKRLTTDWKTASDLINASENKALIANITQKLPDLQFPDEEDLNGAAAALLRLQDTYKLDTSTLAKGLIEGAKPSPELTAGDCFELGRLSYNNNDHYHTVLWMQEAMDRLGEETDKTASKADVLEYLAFSTFMQGSVRHALHLTNKLLEMVPDHPRAKGNQHYYSEALKKTGQYKRGDDGDDVPVESTINLFKKQTSTEELTEREIYERLCRGEKVLDMSKGLILKCRYTHNNNPFLFLQMVKEEEYFLKPRIVVYHDILSDIEIETVKFLAQPKLKRATVQNYKSGELEIASYRISKSAWLKNDEHKIVARITRRVGAVTGLSMLTSEELQVVNYGIGGHYEPHFDFARREEKNAFKSLGTGNRIATWLNYMSDVEAGGATVFPHIGVTLSPKKGAAAFWHNLHKNGEGDMLTRHAACPVLAGSKWVSNKWLHERGQEFLRPCGLSIND